MQTRPALPLVHHRRLQLHGPLEHPLLELAVESRDLGLRLRQLGSLDHFPAATTLRDRELVRARHVEELGRAGRRERIGTEHQHRVIADAPVQLPLVFHEVPPLLLLEPRGVPGHPDALIASGQRPLELGAPVADDPMKIDFSSGEIDVARVQDLDAVAGHIAVEVWNGPAGPMPVCRSAAVMIDLPSTYGDGAATWLTIRRSIMPGTAESSDARENLPEHAVGQGTFSARRACSN